jgi:hypothetical protein
MRLPATLVVCCLFTADADRLVTTGEWRQGRDNHMAPTDPAR